MDKRIEMRIRNTLKRIVTMLVEADYRGLETLTNSKRLGAAHIQSGVVEYGRTLIEPPDLAYDDIDVVQVDGRIPPEYSIRYRLFTKEEGQSDLELQVTLVDNEEDAELLGVEIDNLLVP